ncbi:MAG: glycoside hydrolase family 3 [Butyrivibrio sp.]|nr:glycoside hydrolase family 3 [Acetatifactor muris]MCM1559338.1 glycoside hydrolase family 3 [Butyrivibrio sp.]
MKRNSGKIAETVALVVMACALFLAVVFAVIHFTGQKSTEEQSSESLPTEDMTRVSDTDGGSSETGLGSSGPENEAPTGSNQASDTEPEAEEGSGDTADSGEESGNSQENTPQGAESAEGSESPTEQESAPAEESEAGPEQAPALPEALLANMSTREKVYQLFMVFPSAVTGVSPVTKAGDRTRQALADYPVGGFIYDKTNMVSRAQVTEMLTKVQTYSKIPLILTCDEEGGRVNRLMSTVGTTYIDSMMSYRDQGPEKAAENAEIIAKDLVSCGFNTDLAPVADVWSNPENKVIGDRAYSDDFAQAATLVASAVEGFHAGGVACTLKHFPGHGDTAADSHTGAAYVTKTLEELRSGELLPFQAGIDAGADMVMIGHLTVSDIEEVPALFSYRIVTELLREEMGFEGVVITDSLQMKAVTDYYDSGQAAVLAIQAGVDILLCPEDLEAAANALINAVETGVITEERLNESALRILRLKEKMGIL